MKWPQIPETLAGLNADQLRELAVALRAALDANLATAATPDDFAEYDAYTARFTRIDAMAHSMRPPPPKRKPQPRQQQRRPQKRKPQKPLL